jgi:CMP/dCMP kinase
MSKLNITITGDLGSGKSSIAKELCRMLDYKYFSTGSIQREMGKKTGMDTLALNYLAETNEDIDKYIDNLIIEKNEEKDSFVLDSRMAWHFIKKSFKIYLTVNPIVAAKRVTSDNQRESEPVFEDIYKKSLNLLERRAAENKRFSAKYGVDCSDLNNFDVVIDTTIPTVKEISDLIFQLFMEYSNGRKIHRYFVSPMILYPTANTRKSGQGEVEIISLSNPVEDREKYSIVESLKLGTGLFIWDGHEKVSTAIFNKIPIIPINILAKDNEEIQPGSKVSDFIKTTFNLSWLQDWENVHGFKFESYPCL